MATYELVFYNADEEERYQGTRFELEPIFDRISKGMDVSNFKVQIPWDTMKLVQIDKRSDGRTKATYKRVFK